MDPSEPLVPPAPDDDEEDEEDTVVDPFLPQDDDGPFSVPSDITGGSLPPDHPATDANIQPEEAYDEGLDGAAEVSDPLHQE